MDVAAHLRFARVTPRKARVVARMLAGLPVPVAQARLKVLPQRVAPLLLKVLNSAAANARHNFGLDPKALTIRQVLVNEGPRLRRYQPRARGVAFRILKRTSHVKVVLSDQAAGGLPGGVRRGRKTEMVTKKAEELKPEELKRMAAEKERRPGAEAPGAIKPVAPLRGGRTLIERKHGGE